MTLIVYLLIYGTVLTFLIACIVRSISYANKPIHLRWELYPVPHEEPSRVEHGGSYFESTDWWTKPTHFNLMGELKFMVPEMVFLKGLWEFNRKLWFRSFPFHFGLYLLIGTLALLFVSALIAIFAPAVMENSFGTVLQGLYTIMGLVGIILTILGATGLLIRRITDRDLKNYTVPGDKFNLIFFIIALGLLLLGYITKGPDAPSALAFAQGLLTFDTSIQVSPLLAVGLMLSGLLVAYIPMTHMSHFIAKYFTYHSIRWDDRPTAKNEQIARKIAEVLSFKPTWAAPHMFADGTRTWVDVATTNPTEGEKK
jgi:nitrate reductase gamma subunit